MCIRDRHFRVHAGHIIEEMQAALSTTKESGEPSGLLRIGTIESLCFSRLPQVLDHFRTNLPKVRIQLITGSPEELMEKLDRSQVDLIYFLDRPLYENRWVKVLEEQEDIVFVCAPSFPLAKQQGLCLKDLLDFPFPAV